MMAEQRLHAFGNDALGADDVVGLRERLERREVSPAELLAAARSRAEALQPRVNAVVAWAFPPHPRPDPQAPLSGIPTVVKDNEPLAGVPTREGSRATADRPAPTDGVWAAQFLALGAVPIGKSTLPEFGLTSTTESLFSGPTRNPWNLGRSVGGSSGGSAALVAGGAVPIGHANDGGGSIRIPASCCGLVGLKPSRGRIIDLPEIEKLPVNVVTQGVVTRSVRDTALYFAAAERIHRNSALPPVGHITHPSDRRLRIAVTTSGHPRLPTEPAVASAVRDAARLCESLGHHVEEVEFPYGEQVGVDFLRYWAFLAYGIKRLGGRMFGKGFRADLLEPFTLELAGMFSGSAERLPAAVRRLKRFGADYDASFDRFDVLLSPVTAHEPPPIGYLGALVEPRTHLVRLLRYVSVTPLQNIAGAPGISLPLGMSAAGVPIGVHAAARTGDERTLLELALELEQAAPFARIQTT